VPGELFVELGMAIKRGAPAVQTLIGTYTNDDLGYIPSRPEYERGGYEISEAYKYYGYPAALAPEAGEWIVQAALDLLGSCTD
jgi:neutral ceramidase